MGLVKSNQEDTMGTPHEARSLALRVGSYHQAGKLVGQPQKIREGCGMSLLP